MLGGTFNPLTSTSRDQYDRISARLREERRSGSREAAFEYRLISMAAFPTDFAGMVRQLQAGDARAVGPAIDWLDADAFCMHSGYAKERVMRYLARSQLSTRQAARIRSVLLRVVGRGGRPEFRMACRLARVVKSAEFLADLETLTRDDDDGTAQRAMWMLEVCRRSDPRA